ncbi:MAG: hypothetical protein ACI8UO_001908 [Verrucomicrobiales bacterium]|jgi:hypothetical protein
MHSIRYSLALAAVGALFATGSATAQDEKIDFEKQIYPLIEESCKKCHRPAYEDERGRLRRPKAGLVVTNKEALLKGAEEDGEVRPVLAPGKPDDSSFYTRTLLELEDDEHMPPEDKAPQWTDEQKGLFAAWIKAGADFGDWAGDPKPNELPAEQ